MVVLSRSTRISQKRIASMYDKLRNSVAQCVYLEIQVN